jgi:hypothetical protein
MWRRPICGAGAGNIPVDGIIEHLTPHISPKAAMAAPGHAGVTEQAVAPAVRSSCRILQQTYETEKRNRISGLNLFHIS